MRRYSDGWLINAPVLRVRFQEWLADPLLLALPSAAQMVATRAGWLIFVMGSIEDDPHSAATQCFGDGRDFADHWPAVRKLFTLEDDGRLTHHWWCEMREKCFDAQARAQNAARMSHASRKQKQQQKECGGTRP